VARAKAPSPTRKRTLASGMEALREWFSSRGWQPFTFQEEAWAAYARGESGLINVPTGAGKTYASYLGPLSDIVDEAAEGKVQGLRILYITPLRAVSRDIEAALKEPVTALGLQQRIKVESRTGDTSSSVRARQKRELPPVLITTPESLSLLLSLENSAELFAGLRAVIADEWHELLSSKRGTQTELGLARLRALAPRLRTWALSATLANLQEAARAAVGGGAADAAPARIIRAEIRRPIRIETLIPSDPGRLPWAGHLGLRMLPELLAALSPERSTLIFTNTRSQAEIWYQAIRFSRPEWGDVLALHHGSIDRAERERVERGLKSGSIRLVVCTSSLDLGVDFAPVEVVVQVGSPKGVARLMQRAGRAGHRPGAECRIICIPTHAMELVEVASVRHAIAGGEIEPRAPLTKPLDVLAQHLVTCALGGGFEADALFPEVRSAWTYRTLTREEFDWALALVREGGGTLRAYPEFHKVVLKDGRYTVENKRIAQLHRLNVGTITGDATVTLRYTSGRTLGSIEESFVARLRPGERFFFAGKTLEFVRMVDLEAFVRPSRGRTNYTPRWSGTKLPISESLSEEIRRTLSSVGEVIETADPAAIPADLEPELRAALPMLEVQARLSRIPSGGGVLTELLKSREGHHLFLFPFEGRLVHGGLAALLALRLTRLLPATFSLSVNDYGLELLSPDPLPFQDLLTPTVLSEDRLAEDAVDSVNISALARAQFREIARVAGLVFSTYPGARKSGRQLQASSSLLFDVYSEFDPGNLLLEQARREVLERHFEESRLARTLRRLREADLIITRPERPTPLAFPLMLERFSGKMSSQTLLERLERMRLEWEGGPEAPPTATRVRKPRVASRRRSVRR
jgi:ATP-dependent helicase Lhr and Lhr-like helicase